MWSSPSVTAAEGPAGAVHVGDEVIAFRAPGSYAERLIVQASAVVPKPPTLSFEEGAGLMLAGTTAVHALRAVGVKRGETLVLHGASGGVGLLAVQLAVAEGVRVIGTASEGTHAELRRLGAEPVRLRRGAGGADQGAGSRRGGCRHRQRRHR